MTRNAKAAPPSAAERAVANAQRVVDDVGTAVVAGRLRKTDVKPTESERAQQLDQKED